MKLPRLPKAGASKKIAIQVSKQLSPYMERWYADMQLPNETVADFCLRMLKESAINHYLKKEMPAIVSAIEIDHDKQRNELAVDVAALSKALG